jgi:DNA-binding response OmpR family regulator
MSRPKRILLIDHEPHLTAIVSSALQSSAHYLIRQQTYGAEVLAVALDFQPDLILLDAEPEHLELDQVAQQIHAETALQNVPVLCLTKLTANGQIGSVGFLGGYTFLANPFRLDDMVSCIAEILKMRRAGRS